MQRDTSGNTTITQKLSVAIHKSRFILISTLGVLILLVAAWIIASEITEKRIESSTVLVESAEEKLDNWLNEEDQERASTLGDEIVGDLQRVIDGYPRLYAGQRARFLLGSFYFHSKEWELSSEAFLGVADKFPKSYLAPVSMINAATAYEEAGNNQQAIELCERIIAKYGDSSPEVPRVLFTLGRLHESSGRPDKALEYYNELVDKYASSGWTNLAQDRIIYLNLD